jgi:hydroxymethylpyrimidine pyrophosphatase-like HAD family hydrolase
MNIKMIVTDLDGTLLRNDKPKQVIVAALTTTTLLMD